VDVVVVSGSVAGGKLSQMEPSCGPTSGSGDSDSGRAAAETP
jgi:hypothetical protein